LDAVNRFLDENARKVGVRAEYVHRKEIYPRGQRQAEESVDA
jgi:hypothetical protein